MARDTKRGPTFPIEGRPFPADGPAVSDPLRWSEDEPLRFAIDAPLAGGNTVDGVDYSVYVHVVASRLADVYYGIIGVAASEADTHGGKSGRIGDRLELRTDCSAKYLALATDRAVVAFARRMAEAGQARGGEYTAFLARATEPRSANQVYVGDYRVYGIEFFPGVESHPVGVLGDDQTADPTLSGATDIVHNHPNGRATGTSDDKATSAHGWNVWVISSFGLTYVVPGPVQWLVYCNGQPQ